MSHVAGHWRKLTHSAELMVGPDSGARCAIRDTGAPPLGVGPLREQPLEDAPRDPYHSVVLADLDPELHRLPLGRPTGFLGNEGWETVPRALSWS